jgi:hypothetical protein
MRAAAQRNGSNNFILVDAHRARWTAVLRRGNRLLDLPGYLPLCANRGVALEAIFYLKCSAVLHSGLKVVGVGQRFHVNFTVPIIAFRLRLRHRIVAPLLSMRQLFRRAVKGPNKGGDQRGVYRQRQSGA